MVNTFHNWFYYGTGIVFLLLSRIRFLISGYSPKPFSLDEAQRCIEYDIRVVDRWITQLQEYTGENTPDILKHKSVLELGPGSDLGVGLYILSKSAKDYHAVDVYNLVESVPAPFYDAFFKYLSSKDKIDVSPLVEELEKTRKGLSDKLNYHWREDFDIAAALSARKVDIVFSNAAFEHFDKIEETIKSVSTVAARGARLISLVDLKTHSRWIREKDPNNIYRYPKWLYDLLSFRSTPNRIRPCQYKAILEKNGWENVQIKAARKLDGRDFDFMKNHLNKDFANEKNQMDYLEIWIYATKS